MNTATPYRTRCNGQGDLCINPSATPLFRLPAVFDACSPNLSPTPLPLAGDASVGCLGCSGISYDSTPDGANWKSAFCGAAELWQSDAQDMITLQNAAFTAGAGVDLGSCVNKIGFKKYAAAKHWPGCYGWLSNDNCNFGETFGQGTMAWTASYGGLAIGNIIFDTNGNLQTVTALTGAGTTGATMPGWSTVNGDTTVDGDVTWTCGTAFHPRGTGSPDQTRYRTWTVASTLFATAGVTGLLSDLLNADEDDFQGYFYDTASGGRTVNFLTGEITSSLLTTKQQWTGPEDTDGAVNVYNSSGGAGFTQNPDGTGRVDYTSGLTTELDLAVDGFCIDQVQIPFLIAGDGFGPADFGETMDLYELIINWNADGYGSGPLPPISDPTDYSASVAEAPGDLGISISLSKNNLAYSWDIEITFNGGTVYHYYGSVTLSDACTAASVRADVEGNLLSVWGLNGPEAWRTDAWTSIMPLVQRREVQFDVTPIGFNPATVNDLRDPLNDSSGNTPFSMGWAATYSQIGWFDPNAWYWVFPAGMDQTNSAASSLNLMMDGAIIGAPHPDGPAAEGWFDFYYIDERFCPYVPSGDCMSGQAYGNYIYEYGGNQSDAAVSLCSAALYGSGISFSSFLPGNATHWVRNDMAHNLPRGALIDIGLAGTSNSVLGIVEIKAAFSRVPVPSYNFARPCGSDRVLIDEPTAQCFTGSDLVMQAALPDGGSYPALESQQVLIWGATDVPNGIYTGCTQSGTTLSPGSLIADLPSDYFHPFLDYFAYGYCGIVRFSGLNGSTAAAALCGRQAVTVTDLGGDTSKITFGTAQTNLRAGDALDFWASDMTSVASDVTIASRTDDSNFVVDVAASTLTGTAWATSHGAPGYWWNDAAEKFDFRTGGWTTMQRAAGGWFASTFYFPGQPITDSNGNIQTASGGTTGATEPVWNTSGTTGDGGVTWTCTATFGGCADRCETYDVCGPQVYAFTPNSDVNADWGAGWFGAGNIPDFVADGVYGSRVQANVEFEMLDALYQAPTVPCPTESYAYEGVADNGGCAADASEGTPRAIYSPPAPVVEARCGLPLASDGEGAGATRSEDAPALPVDAVNGQVAWPAMVQPPNPGVITEYYNVAMEPWMRYFAELAAGSGCRWAAYYYALTPGN